MSKLLAPNGKPSNLTPEQYKLVRSSAFKKWFGDWENDPANASKVVDVNGEPLPVYHGTQKEFNVFDVNPKERVTNDWNTSLGVHFSESKIVAENFSKGLYSNNKSKGVIKEVFLNLKNPKTKNKFISKSNEDKTRKKQEQNLNEWKSLRDEYDLKSSLITESFDLFKIAKEKGIPQAIKIRQDFVEDKIGKPPILKYEKQDDFRYNEEELLEELTGLDWFFVANMKAKQRYKLGSDVRLKLLNNGFDGVIYINSNEKENLGIGRSSIAYIVFEPNQIKLADGTNTTFDSNNNDIRYKQGGNVNENFTPIFEWRMVGIEQEDGTLKYVPYSEFYLWIYDDVQAEQKLKDGIYEYPYPTIYFNDDLESIWTENKFKRYKGNKHIVGFIYGQVSKYFSKEGYRDMQIYVMTTKPNFRRIGVNQFAIRYLRKKFNLDKEQVEFKLPTQQGKLFISSNQYKQGGLIAPNGKPSNLNPEQYKLVRTPAFKKWFGDWEKDPANASKVIDEKTKEPLVVYHGTDKMWWVNNKFIFNPKLEGESSEIKRGEFGGVYFSSNINVAMTYGENILSVFLKIKNPTLIKGKNKYIQDVYDCEEKNIGCSNEDVIIKDTIDNYPNDYFFKILDNNEIETKKYFKTDIFIVRNSNQIKLADGSNTTFDSGNSDIRFDKGGGVDYSDFKTSVIGLVKDNKVLILKRGSTANWMPNKWSLVGGVVDSGEEPKEAIIRECFEEIGLKPINVSFNHKIMTNDSGEIYYFNGELESENVKLDYENSTFKFIAKDEINNYDFVPYIKEFIIDIFSKKINNNNITFNSGGELNKGLFAQIWGWFGIKF